MQLHNLVLEALDRVLAWDLDDDSCLDAVPSEAGLLAGVDSDAITTLELD